VDAGQHIGRLGHQGNRLIGEGVSLGAMSDRKSGRKIDFQGILRAKSASVKVQEPSTSKGKSVPKGGSGRGGNFLQWFNRLPVEEEPGVRRGCGSTPPTSEGNTGGADVRLPILWSRRCRLPGVWGMKHPPLWGWGGLIPRKKKKTINYLGPLKKIYLP